MIVIPHYLLGQKAAMAAAVSSLFLFLCLVAVSILASFSAQSDELLWMRERLARYNALVAARPGLSLRLQELRQRAQDDKSLLISQNSDSALVELQQEFQKIAQDNGIIIEDAKALGSATGGGFERISIQYRASLALNRLKDALYGIETHVPRLLLGRVEITSIPTMANGEMPQLRLDIIISGYRWVGQK